MLNFLENALKNILNNTFQKIYVDNSLRNPYRTSYFKNFLFLLHLFSVPACFQRCGILSSTFFRDSDATKPIIRITCFLEMPTVLVGDYCMRNVQFAQRCYAKSLPLNVQILPCPNSDYLSWRFIKKKTFIWSYFFKPYETVDGNRYLWMLIHYVCPQIREIVLSVTGFNKTALRVSLQINLFSFCNENLNRDL